MNMKEAMASYFAKLEALYQKMFGTLPTVSWDPDADQSLFIGTADEDDEIQWKPKAAAPVRMEGLCEELRDFFGSWYYWQLRGEYSGIRFSFPAIPDASCAEDTAQCAIADGNYYFSNQNVVYLASCSFEGNDDLLLFYRQASGELFLYDVDKRFVLPQNYSLVDLISSMKAVL